MAKNVKVSSVNDRWQLKTRSVAKNQNVMKHRYIMDKLLPFRYLNNILNDIYGKSINVTKPFWQKLFHMNEQHPEEFRKITNWIQDDEMTMKMNIIKY